MAEWTGGGFAFADRSVPRVDLRMPSTVPRNGRTLPMMPSAEPINSNVLPTMHSA